MAISLPRNIPIADVTLDQTYNMRTHPTFSAQCNMYDIFKDGLITDDPAQGGPNQDFVYVDGQNKKVIPKKFLATAVGATGGALGVGLIGHYAVLTPKVLTKFQTVFDSTILYAVNHTTLNSNTWGRSDQRQTTDSVTTRFSNTTINGVSWISKRIESSNTTSEMWHTILSNFSLFKNQPFIINIGFTSTISNSSSAVLASWFDANSNTLRAKITEASYRINGGVLINVGDYLFIVYATNPCQCVVYKIVDREKEAYERMGSLQLTKTDNHVTIAVYPIDSTLYVYNGIPSTDKTMKREFLSIYEDAPINYSGQIYLEFFGGPAIFSFAPIVHQRSVTLASPRFLVPFTTVDDQLDTFCVGKTTKQVLYKHSQNLVQAVTWDAVKDPLYSQYVSAAINGTVANASTPTEAGTERYYSLTLTARSLDTERFEDTTYYSPAVYRVDYWANSPNVEVDMDPTPQIDNADVRQITISENVENSTCSILLNNRVSSPARHRKVGGRYTYPDPFNTKSNFCGVKPITVKLGYKGEDTEVGPITRFSGFVVERQYSRPNSSESNVILSCVDRKKQLQESYACNLPIYDGWCHLAVMYDLAREAGFTDDQILFYQDPVDGEDIIRIYDILINAESDPGTKSGACFDGHPEKFPDGIPGRFLGETIPGEYLHGKVSTAPLLSPPKWMFEMGTSIWDCMMRVRAYTHFLLFVNNFGNIVYCPPHYYYAASEQLTFREMPETPGDFNEVQSAMTLTLSTENTRGGVVVGGLIPIGKDVTDTVLTPTYQILRDSNWPNNVADHAYAPWMRWVFDRDPMIADPTRLAFKASELYRRVTRDMRTVSFETWGNPQVHPYQIIRVIERSGEFGNPSGSPDEGALYIVSSVTHTLTEDKTYSTHIDAEIFQPGSYTFGPLEV